MKNLSEYQSLKKTINTYISKYDVPTRESNIQNIIELRLLSADSKEAKKLRDKIILSNGGFVMSYVIRYHRLLNDDASIAELFQEAMIGIMESIDTFDITRDTSFTTYAYFHIKRRIIDFIKHNKLIRAPRDVARNIKHVTEVIEKLYSTKGIEPTSFEVKKALRSEKQINLKEKIVEDIMILIELNASNFEDSFISEYKDNSNTADDNTLFNKMKTHILSQLSNFDDVKRKAISLRFGLGYDFSHTAEEIKFILGLDKDLGEL